MKKVTELEMRAVFGGHEYKCPFCGFSTKSRATYSLHANHCVKNPCYSQG
jgi:uncharacterized C2H2 Zn-finger protein